MEYSDFLSSKRQLSGMYGFDPVWMCDLLYPFQADLVEWALKKGRAAIFADCGLGKTPMQLVWAENIVRKTNKPVLILTPLAVAQQTIREGAKFGIECVRSRDGKYKSGARIVVSNYQRLHHFNPSDFSGCVCDESSILKHFDGATKAAVTEFMRTMKYRLLCTATAAPNDHIELGTSSEALGELGYMDMITRFFRHDNKYHRIQSRFGVRYHLRKYAERDFWRWVCSWARALRMPEDLGHDNNGFILPELTTNEIVVKASKPRPNYLFDLPAITLQEQKEERRRTIPERCEMAARLVNGKKRSSVCWCYLNDEGNTMERLIPDAVQVSGKDDDDKREEIFCAFQDGDIRVLISKPTIAGFGLNWQHCSHQTFFPSHSYEQWYQAVRRSWRFGQKNKVEINVIASEGEAGVLRNLRRKDDAMREMFSSMVGMMGKELIVETIEKPLKNEEVPSWV